MPTRGIRAAAAYVPRRRLDRAAVAALLGRGGGSGTRAVASYDEDTTTMAVEAARPVRRGLPDDPIDSLWFATSAPAYLDKTNATAIHAALRLDRSTMAIDTGGAARSGVGALRAALEGRGSTLVAMADQRSGAPTSAEEAQGGDGAAALLVADADHGPLAAEYVGGASVTEEFLERWRLPVEAHSSVWEERFAESVYPGLVKDAWAAALAEAGVGADAVDTVVVAGSHARTVKRLPRVLGVEADVVVSDHAARIGNPVTAQAGIGLVHALETAEPGATVALVSAVDGADVLIFRVAQGAPALDADPVAAQAESGDDVDYGTFLTWRGELAPLPPNRPPPARASAPPSYRQRDWKFGFVGSRDRSSEALHLPPARVSFEGGAVDEMDAAPMADVPATIVTFTVDRLSYSLSPPIVFAVVDFDGGGRLACELTDVDADTVRIGDRVEMTFRRLMTTEGIHNYFWKARPARGDR